MITRSKKERLREVKWIWIRHEKTRHKHAFRIRLGTKMHKLFNAWCRRFGGGKPVTAFRFFFKGKLIDGEQTAADIDIRRAIDLDVADYINVTSLPEVPEVTLPITRSNSKKIRENVRRLPHEVEATLSKRNLLHWPDDPISGSCVVFISLSLYINVEPFSFNSS